MKQIILTEHEVPVGEICWARGFQDTICGYFDNEGGTPSCDLFDRVLKERKEDSCPMKCEECLSAKVKEE